MRRRLARHTVYQLRRFPNRVQNSQPQEEKDPGFVYNQQRLG